MTRLTPLALALALVPAAARADEAKDIAQAFLDRGARAFEEKDPGFLADTFAPEGRLTVYTRDSADSTLKREEYVSHREIQDAYAKLFDTDKPVKGRNVVETARLIDPELIMVTGTFEVSAGDGDPIRLPFTQVRQKQGSQWLVRSMEVFIVPQKN